MWCNALNEYLLDTDGQLSLSAILDKGLSLYSAADARTRSREVSMSRDELIFRQKISNVFCKKIGTKKQYIFKILVNPGLLPTAYDRDIQSLSLTIGIKPLHCINHINRAILVLRAGRIQYLAVNDLL